MLYKLSTRLIRRYVMIKTKFQPDFFWCGWKIQVYQSCTYTSIGIPWSKYCQKDVLISKQTEIGSQTQQKWHPPLWKYRLTHVIQIWENWLSRTNVSSSKLSLASKSLYPNEIKIYFLFNIWHFQRVLLKEELVND